MRLEWQWQDDRLTLWSAALGRALLVHSPADACVAIGHAAADIQMVRGNFAMADRDAVMLSLGHATTDPVDPAAVLFAPMAGQPALLRMSIIDNALHFAALMPGYNRFSLAVTAQPGERLRGGGEQMSYLTLNGRDFPLWTSEPGVGRDKTRELTRIMDAEGLAGGDYWTTNYPQPTWLSSSGYALHVDSRAYCGFDFTNPALHRIRCWEVPGRIELFHDPDPVGLVGQLSTRFGRQPGLPIWSTGGAIIGLKDGAASFDRLARIRAAGVAVAGLWCEDWCGIRQTSFGRRLFWDWRWNAARHPGLPARIAELASDGIRFMGYVNPYLAVDGPLYAEAAAAGLLAQRHDSDAPYHVDFGEFDAAIVDFTNPLAADWFAERVIGRELVDFGLSGWMADFGEYLPTDVSLFDGSDALLRHNIWPLLWARVNAAGVASRGRTDDIVWFMRAGHSDIGGACPLLWAGDQCVDFSRHDGLGTVLTAALSAGLLGNAWHHSDCGGYTSLHGVVRSQELMLRWADMAAFAPVLRTHEGNRPDDNLQIDSNPALLAHFALVSRLHLALGPYVQALAADARDRGTPLMRAMFLHYPNDIDCADLQDQYCYGRDLLVAPVIEAGAANRLIYIPHADDWQGLYDGLRVAPGWQTVAAPFGLTPAFVRAGGDWADRLLAIGAAHLADWTAQPERTNWHGE